MTIDDYQGEENKIIILSLVRSNPKSILGFVEIENRIIVALSRAKYGLYIVGNSNCLKSSNIWNKVLKHLEKQNLISTKLVVQCSKHPSHKMGIEVGSKDFKLILHGGCLKECDHQFDCGHSCGRPCHPKSHKKLKCKKLCLKQHEDCDHRCQSICHFGKSSCPQCQFFIDYQLPDCNHTMKVKWSIEKNLIICKNKCGKINECQHPCSNECNECKKKI